MKNDGSVIIDTKLDTKGFGKGVSNMQTQFAKMGNAVRKIGGAVAAAFSVRAIVNFAKEAIELGSDLQEVQNVVDVTFGNMSEYINQFAKNAITQFGLSELSAKQYASTLGAIFKSTGFDVAAATEMSQVLTGLAGNIASFYNLTGDEAFAKLRAGITGETEPLKQLGINLSVANLEAYALSQGITKAYDAMSQQEQMLLRYNYILSVTADAQEDFARTSDRWANQTKILSEQFKSLKATIGQGLINALTPVIQVINTILVGLQKVANAFLQFTELLFGKAGGAVEGAESIANSYGAAADSAESMAASTAAGGKAAKKYLSGLDEINTYTDSSGGGGGGGGAAGSDLFADFDLAGSLSNAATITEGVSAFVQELVKSIKAGDWGEVGNALAQKVNTAFAKIDGKKIAKTLSETIRGALQGGTGFLKGLDGKKLGNEIYNFIVGIDWGGIIHDIIMFVGSAFDLAGEIIWGILEPMIDDISEWFVENFTENGKLTGESFLKGLGTMFNNIGAWLRENIFNPISKAFGLEFALDGSGSGWSFDIGSKISGGLLSALTSLPGKAGGIFSDLRKKLEEETGKTDLSLSETWGLIRDGLLQVFSEIPDGISSALSTLKMKLTYAINNYIILPINMLLKKIIDGINTVFDSINSIGAAIGLSKYVNIGRVRMVSIPYLAQGAVIPPNAPFAAVLGDQKNGRNLEAPESLIRQIIREEMSANNGGGNVFHIVAQLNGQTLFEQMIEEAELRQAATGQDPFALA